MDSQKSTFINSSHLKFGSNFTNNNVLRVYVTTTIFDAISSEKYQNTICTKTKMLEVKWFWDHLQESILLNPLKHTGYIISIKWLWKSLLYNYSSRFTDKVLSAMSGMMSCVLSDINQIWLVLFYCAITWQWKASISRHGRIFQVFF